jgi:hypothetical protein
MIDEQLDPKKVASSVNEEFILFRISPQTRWNKNILEEVLLKTSVAFNN